MASLLQGCSSRLRSTDRARPGAHPCLSVCLSVLFSFAVGEATAGKASRSLAQHIPGSGGIEGVRGAAGGVIGDLTRARIALDERGQKLGELDERTASMMASAEAFSKHAHEVGAPAPTPCSWELPTLQPFHLGKPSVLLSLHPVTVLEVCSCQLARHSSCSQTIRMPKINCHCTPLPFTFPEMSIHC